MWTRNCNIGRFCHIDRIDQADILLVPRVVTAPRHGPGKRHILTQTKAGADRGGKCLVGVIERQPKFRKARHQPFGVMTKTLLGSS
jgi:hypothetical protein